MSPARTPDGVDLAAMVERRLHELPVDGLLFPSPRGRWPRRSNYRRNVFDPAATTAGWPRHGDGTLVWTFHSLRHVFATWALAQPGARIEDVSRLLGTPPCASPKTSTSPPTPTSTTASTKPPPDNCES
jgi:integrase